MKKHTNTMHLVLCVSMMCIGLCLVCYSTGQRLCPAVTARVNTTHSTVSRGHTGLVKRMGSSCIVWCPFQPAGLQARECGRVQLCHRYSFTTPRCGTILTTSLPPQSVYLPLSLYFESRQPLFQYTRP